MGFLHKFLSYGALDRYKARWILRNFTQQHRVDYGENFYPVVKPATIRTVLSVSLSHICPIHHMDVKNAFLHGALTETDYCKQPPSFIDSSYPYYVCRLNNSIYGLKQAPCDRYNHFASYIILVGFARALSDTSLFIYCCGADTTYLLLYVDDVVLTAFSDALLCHIIDMLQNEFAMKDLGELHHFLSLSVTCRRWIVLIQRQYTLDILARAGMVDCKPCATLVDTSAKLLLDGPPVDNTTHYRGLAGAL